jgi:Mg-chelatase subunit ChlD
LVVYSTNATEENELTLDFMPLADKLTQRQAAGSTNIGDGIRLAREEIAQRGRLGAFKLIVLMTDGEANAPYSSTTACKDYVIQQANLAQQEGIVILTIGMGADSDQSLMQQVASITGGVYFYVPGGSDPGDYEAQLRDVFQQVARARPLQLVQ